MTIIPPRLGSILTILLESGEPVTIDRLSTELSASRRTVFRALEGADKLLRPYGLSLGTKTGKGIQLTGDAEQKRLLSDRLAGAGASHYAKQDRQTLLAFLLMDECESQKLYYYARALGVSEATVSMDMDVLAERLKPYGLSINRRQGAELIGEEEDVRRAMVSLAGKIGRERLARFDHPPAAVVSAIDGIIAREWPDQLDWMTAESLDMLKLRLSVMADRARRRFTLPNTAEPPEGLPGRLANRLCDSIEGGLAVALPTAERAAVCLFLRACRAKRLNPMDGSDAAAYSQTLRLAHRMIDAFDPALSASLKLSEDLTEGLTLHLWSAVVRLKQGVELDAELCGQIMRDYPDIFEKSRAACNVLAEEFGVPVPEGEVAFIASHFGAAILRMNERGRRRLPLKVGVVCVAGIGVSYMMASQINKRFQGALDVTVSDWNDPSGWRGYDLLVSAAPLTSVSCPVITVQPILSEDDYNQIRQAAQTANRIEAPNAAEPQSGMAEKLEAAAARFAQIAAIAKGLRVLRPPANCAFEELAELVSRRFSESGENAERVKRDLLRREAVSTQVVSRLGVVLLHTRSEGVAAPMAALFAPNEGRFTDPYFCGAAAGILLLAPKDGCKDALEAFGYISGAIIEDPAFLTALKAADMPAAQNRAEAALLKYLRDSCTPLFGKNL